MTTRAEGYKRQHAKLVDYKTTFNSEAGKKVLIDLINAHWMTRPTFHESATEMAFREGERNVVLRILHMLNVDASKMLHIIEEARNAG